MSNDNAQPIRGYYRASKAYYANAHHRETQEVIFGLYYPNEGCEAEMEMTWVEVQGRIPKLKVYGEAFMTLHKFADVIEAIAIAEELTTLTEEWFCQILDSLGFTDMTMYTEKES